MLDLAFRNESSSVIEKAKAKQKARNTKAGETTLREPTPPKRKTTNKVSSKSLQRSQSQSASSPLIVDHGGYDGLYLWNSLGAALPSSLSERGTTYFVNNFVAGQSGPSHGHFNYLTELCRNGGMDETLSSSMTAVGLAACSNRSHSPELLGEARREYVVALRRVNSALLSPTDALKDSTLLSIMILTIYETVTCTNQLSQKAWTEHINGASTLLKVRGPGQFKTRVGIGLFMQTSSHLLISAVKREIPMPPEIVALRAQVRQRLNPIDPAFRFVAIIDRFAKFRADIRSRQLGNSSNIIRVAVSIDEDLVQVFTNVPPGWEYETAVDHENKAPHVVYNGKYDIYYDYWIARIWNSMRNVRMLLNEVIRQHILEGFRSTPPLFTDESYTSQFQLSTNALVEMRDGILRSIPQCLGYVTRKPSSWLRSTSASAKKSKTSSSAPSSTDPFASLYPEQEFNSNCHPDNITPDAPSLSATPNPSHPAIGAYFLVWPLYIAGVSRFTIPSQRAFILSCLRRLYTDLGIAQGNALATYMETNQTGGTMGVGQNILEMGGLEKELKGVVGPLPYYELS